MALVWQHLLAPAVLLSAAVLAAACDDGRPRRSSDDDATTSAGGAFTGSGGATAGPGSGGATTVPGGPEITFLVAHPDTLTENATTYITAMVTDEDGVDDIVGGVLTNASGDTVIGTFWEEREEGVFGVQASWGDLHAAEPLTFDGQTTRTLVARFTDTTQKAGTRSITLTLTCDGETATNGICGDCYSCSEALFVATGDQVLCGNVQGACEPDSPCERWIDLWVCACQRPASCVEVCTEQDLCQFYVPISSECVACLSQQCPSQYAACD